jgi:hypothetical protein
VLTVSFSTKVADNHGRVMNRLMVLYNFLPSLYVRTESVPLIPLQSAECLVPSGALPTTFLCSRCSDPWLSGLACY